LHELAQEIVVLTEPGDVGDDAEVVGVVSGIVELFERVVRPMSMLWNQEGRRPG